MDHPTVNRPIITTITISCLEFRSLLENIANEVKTKKIISFSKLQFSDIIPNQFCLLISVVAR